MASNTSITQASAVDEKPERDDGASPIELAIPAESLGKLHTQSGTGDYQLSLTGVVSASLLQNPDLVAARGQEQVSVAAQGVAETYPWNPFVQSQLLPGTGGDNSTQTSYYFWLMQRFELAHQQRYREEAATALLNQVRWNIHQAELLNVAQTARLYFAAQYQSELYRLANETAELNEKLLGVVQRRFKAGLATSAAVTTAEVAARQSRRQAHLADATYQTAVLAVRQQLNLPVNMPLSMSERLSDYEWHAVTSLEVGTDARSLTTGDSASLAAELASGRPDVLAAQSGVSVAFANAELANAARMPDIQAGPILNTFPNGAETLGVRFQMDLPIWNSGKPLAHQRQVEQRQQALVYEQLRTRATLEAQMAIDRYERARRLAQESQVDLSPIADNPPPDLQSIITQFDAGQADVLAVFATQTSLLQDRRTYLDLLNELAQSAAGVVQATAVPLDRLITHPIVE
ncbi:MAG: TolC family protein [Planctomycetaceae bacterium]